MKSNFKFIQCDCIEGDKVDLSQARAVIKYRPDIIIFEMPAGKNNPNTIFNRYSCTKKPIKVAAKIIKDLKISARKYPYALSDVAVWENIIQLWQEGMNTELYNVDAPAKLREEFYIFQKPVSRGYPAVRRDWLFWVYLYLRDSYMTQNIKIILDTYSVRPDPTILIFLQSIHWKNVRFLLTNPSKEKIWRYYFGRFKEIKPTPAIERQIKSRSPILNRFWRNVQKFY